VLSRDTMQAKEEELIISQDTRARYGASLLDTALEERAKTQVNGF